LVSWGLLATIALLSVIPAAVRPGTGAHQLEHVTIFLLAGFAFGLSYSASWSLATRLVMFAAGIEVVQLFVPGRHARLSDLLLDVAGICAGIFLASARDHIKRALAGGRLEGRRHRKVNHRLRRRNF
jgi:VanZ family protein